MSSVDDGLLTAVRRGVGGTADPVAVAREVRRHSSVVGTATLLESTDHVIAEVVGAGPLQQFLYDDDVSDVLVNGPGPVWVDRGAGPVATDVVLSDEPLVRRLAQRLVAACGRRLDDAVPYADARLPDGTRLHAVLPPLSPGGTLLSLRLPPRRTFTLDDLVQLGSLPTAATNLLRSLVDARVAFVVSGGTGTGKTTVLSTLLSLVDACERIVLVEDASELRPRHPHVVRLESRSSNAEGAGGVDLSVLVRQALRMRPDRLVVGEVRGREVVDLLAALNTGHEGGASTVHANRAAHVPARFEALGVAAGLPRDAVHSQLAAAVEVVLHLRREPGGRRRVAGVALMQVDEAGLVRAVPAVEFRDSGCTDGPAARLLRQRLARDP
ncbi:MAG TPA: TadA family conjugal transfer-associated ATPase [Mycobacteriales bacterium]|nr:TadA family conjugal transfer-associated ATPase [Mycobacteriales bacterium]